LSPHINIAIDREAKERQKKDNTAPHQRKELQNKKKKKKKKQKAKSTANLISRSSLFIK
jgi:hypothetical protein